jgi:outer membrane protein TolC
MHSLAAEVVRTRADLAALGRRLELARGIRASRAQTESTVERRYAAGVSGVGAVDVHLARENLSSAEANLPALEREYALRALALDRLLGRKPGSSQELDLGYWSARPPAQVPDPGLPAALLDRRPDLLASELRAIAANHGIGVALADLYPDLTLSGQASRGINAAGGAFQIDGLVASATAGLSYMLFSGGALRAAARAEQARARAALHDYAGLVLTAFNEVEGALVRERYLAEQLERVTAQQEAARAAETAARGRYEAGLESLLVLLETERRRALAEDLLAQLEAAAWSARIDLILALGGAWWPAGATAESAPAPAEVYGANRSGANPPEHSTQTPALP